MERYFIKYSPQPVRSKWACTSKYSIFSIFFRLGWWLCCNPGSTKYSKEVICVSGVTMGPLTTPKKGREAGSVDPWTPTSNLKMLISAASPDIRNREKELCMDHDGRDSLDASQVQKEGGEKSLTKRSTLTLKSPICYLFSLGRKLKMEKSPRK